MRADETRASRAWAWHWLRTLACAALGSLALTACGQPQPAYMPAKVTADASSTRPVNLAINGFNYTDTVISEFYVNGNGGGNIVVSSQDSGGGKTSCCITWYPGTPLPRPIKVEWLRVINGKDRWCEKTVQLTGPVSANPTAFGVHFMPDGDIQVEITKGYPKMKLLLPNFDDGHRHETGNVIHDEETARCRDGR